jgi:hypothetical protein
MGATGDEVIGYKSIVIEDNNLSRGHVWEVEVSDFHHLTCLSPHQQIRGRQLKNQWSLCPVVVGERLRTTVLQERHGVLLEELSWDESENICY